MSEKALRPIGHGLCPHGMTVWHLNSDGTVRPECKQCEQAAFNAALPGRLDDMGNELGRLRMDAVSLAQKLDALIAEARKIAGEG